MKNKGQVTPVPRVEIHTSMGGSPNGYGGGNSAKGLRNPVLNFNHCKKKRKKKEKRPIKLRCGTWNIQGWRTKDKEVLEEFQRMDIDILIISETKKKGNGTETVDGIFHCWSGVQKQERAKAGIGILMKAKWIKPIKTWEPINERIIKLVVEMYGREFVVLGVYGPTEDSPTNEKDIFMETLQEQIETVKANQELIIAGDLNGRTGKRMNDSTVGPYGEDLTNENGERLIELCEFNNLRITNGFYRHKDIHKYTWTQEKRKLKSIIDYIITNNNSKMSIKDVRVKRGAECGTDHKLLIAEIELPWNWKKHIRPETNRKAENKETKFKIYLLQDESIRHLYQNRLDQKLVEFRFENLTETYEHVKKCIKEAALEALGEEETRTQHKSNFTEDTKECIKEKKLLYQKYLSTKKDDDLEKYKQKNREVKQRTTKEKNEIWERTCIRIEQYLGGTKSSESWKVLKSLRGNTKEKVHINHITEQQWEQYYKDLLTENRTNFTESAEEQISNNQTQVDVSMKELREAIKTIKNNKSAGPGGIAPELIKYGSEKLFRIILQMLQKAINGEELPTEWTSAYITSIFKKGDRRKCENYRGISVISSFGRLYGKVIKNKLEENIKDKIGDDQAGFTAGRSCIDQIYTVQQVIEKKRAKNRAIHCAFIDLKKAYDSVPRAKLWKAMKELNIPQQLIIAVKNMYKNNVVAVKVGNKIGNNFKTTKGLLQGCSTSPTLFKLFIEQVLTPWKMKCEGMGIPVRDSFLYTLSFADDQVVMAQDEEDLSFMVRKLEEEYTKNGLEINLKKTEYLATTEEEVRDLEVDENRQIKGTDKFKYLGFLISKNGTTEGEISNRLGQTRTCIRQLNPVLWDRHITKHTKTIIFQTIVRSIMTYGAENWILNKKYKNKVTATEMEYWRRSCRVTKMDRIRNEEIKRRMGINDDVLGYIEEKRLSWYGHVRRTDRNRWISKVTEWSPIGRRKRGRPRRSWRDEVDEAMERRNLQDGEWQDRDEWRQWLKTGRQRQL